MVPDANEITETLQVGVEAPHQARTIVAGFLDGHPSLADILLATSELVTNVVRHTEGLHALDLCVERRRGAVRVSVRQRGDRFDRVRHLATDPHGRGLTIVEAVTDRWGVESDGFLAVWFEVDDDRTLTPDRSGG